MRDLLDDLVSRRLTDRENIVARATELGADLAAGGSVIVARAVPQQPEEGDWPARVLTVAERGARAVERTCLVGAVELRPGGEPIDLDGRERAGEVVVLVPGVDGELARRVIGGVRRELEAGLPSFHLALGRSRVASDPADLYRAAAEALLAVNVAQAQGVLALNFEETGAYRLLLSSMTDNPAELRSFHDETVAPLLGLRRAVRDRARPHARDVPRGERQRRADRAAPVHPPPHDPLPARAREGADRAGRLVDRRTRAPRPRPEGDARAGHSAPTRPGDRAGSGNRPRAERGQGPLAQPIRSSAQYVYAGAVA